MEGTITDARHAILDNDGFNLFRITIPWAFGRIVIIRHRACATDGKGVSRLHVGVRNFAARATVVRRPYTRHCRQQEGKS